jgi:hypothetical protein
VFIRKAKCYVSISFFKMPSVVRTHIKPCKVRCLAIISYFNCDQKKLKDIFYFYFFLIQTHNTTPPPPKKNSQNTFCYNSSTFKAKKKVKGKFSMSFLKKSKQKRKGLGGRRGGEVHIS